MTFKRTVIAGEFEIEIPLVLGAYRFVGTIAECDFSIICLVTTSSFEYYACKIVPRAVLRDSFMEHFERELRILETLRDPHIVHLVEIIYRPDLIFVIMEYCHRGDLLQLISTNGRLDAIRCRLIFRDILRGLDYLHKRNISHRDIKPENILLDDSGRAKIADFGLSHYIESDHLLETSCGTIGYIAPELLRRESYDGRKADIWSSGILLYAMCSGKLPWSSTNDVDMSAEIARGDFKLPPEASSGIAHLLTWMLKADPAERPTAEELLADQWLSIGVGCQLKGLLKAASLGGSNFDVFAKPMMGRPIIVRPQFTHATF
jgi:serine/threonine protein kinase